MFTNSGKKLKILAKIVFWVVTVLSILGGIIMIICAAVLHDSVQDVESLLVPGILLLILGPLDAFLTSLFLYSWGETVENVDTIKEAVLSSGKTENKPKISSDRLAILLEKGLITPEEYKTAREKEKNNEEESDK